MTLLNGLSTGSAVGPVGIKKLDTGRLAAGLCHNLCGPIMILYASSRHCDCEESAERVDHHVTLLACDFLACIEAALSALR